MRLFIFKIEPQIIFFSLAIEPCGYTNYVFSLQFILQTRGTIIFYNLFNQENIFGTSDDNPIVI